MVPYSAQHERGIKVKVGGMWVSDCTLGNIAVEFSGSESRAKLFSRQHNGDEIALLRKNFPEARFFLVTEVVEDVTHRLLDRF